jgi:hypothetical protein
MFKNILTGLTIAFLMVMNAHAQSQTPKSTGPGADTTMVIKEHLQAADSAAAMKKASLEQKHGAVSIIKLRISADGKSIVDEQGNEIARFVEGMQVKTTGKGQTLTLPGCMCCQDECLVYDSNGKCVKWHRSCTWDFDCNCK